MERRSRPERRRTQDADAVRIRRKEQQAEWEALERERRARAIRDELHDERATTVEKKPRRRK